jgi:TPR repeat protein
VCPITAELPIDPVTAEDGRCYERWAIEEWFAVQPQAQVKSPVTNEPMGKRLLPAVQVRNSLKRLVESGAISGSKADAWKTAMAEEAGVAALRVKAEGGDAMAMRHLGFSYRDGKRGLKTDLTQAFTWFKRAADLKDVYGLAACGIAYIDGHGVERSNIRGCNMISVAATLGSEHACGMLGWANAEGRWGLDEDPQEATRWYREMQKCDCRDSDEETREQAAAWLREDGQGGAGFAPQAGFAPNGAASTQDTVMTYFTRYDVWDIGCAISDCVNAIAPQGVTDAQVRTAVEALVNKGHLYSTIDDEHYKATA